jgi:LCP family protein required for cell wall assembly
MRRWALVLVLGLAALLLPPASAVPATVNLERTEHARAADFEDGVVWFLLLGSDARPGTDVMAGNTDAVELVGIDFTTGRAVLLGVPRDFWVDVRGEGLVRINEALRLGEGDSELVVTTVEELTGIAADYVVTVGLTGFADLVDAIGGVNVYSPVPFNDPDHPLEVERGRNAFDGQQATTFARARKAFAAGDLQRVANHQALLLAIVRQVAGRADEEGFMESGTLAALAALDTNLAPDELYRLGRAVSQLDLHAAVRCVLPGVPFVTSGGALVTDPDEQAIRRLTAEVAEDAVPDRRC